MPRATWIAALGLAACVVESKPPAAPPPLRPPPRESTTRELERDRSDCDPVEGRSGLPALVYEERSIEEAENLAGQGSQLLEAAGRTDEPGAERERLVVQAVARLITALLADPYNVQATYNLAAAYARIGRAQCAVNLLGRLVPLRRLPSQRAEVEARLNRLFGRAGYRGRLDPAFLNLRDDPRFRELAKDF